jgi:iron complex transport system substrate-binding protein
MLFAMRLGQRVVAISHECDFPAEALDRPRVTRSLVDSSQPSQVIDETVKQLSSAGRPLYAIDDEKLAELAPGLIVTQAQCEVCAVSLDDVLGLVQSHPRLRTTRVIALNPISLTGLMADILRVAEAADAEQAGRRLVESLQQRVERVQQRVAGIPESRRPRVACIEWIDPLMIAANWTPELIEKAGGRYELALAGRPSRYSRWEDLLRYDPDVLLVSPCGFDVTRALVESAALFARPEWPEISAVRQQRAFVVDGNAYMNRCGPRLVDSLEILGYLIHPELFPEPAAEKRLWAACTKIGH